MTYSAAADLNDRYDALVHYYGNLAADAVIKAVMRIEEFCAEIHALTGERLFTAEQIAEVLLLQVKAYEHRGVNPLELMNAFMYEWRRWVCEGDSLAVVDGYMVRVKR